MKHAARTLPVVVLAIMAVACGGDDDPVSTSSTAESPTTAEATTTSAATTSEATTTTIGATTTSGATSTTGATTTTESGPPTTIGPPEAGFPPELTELTHGAATWVVVLAAGPEPDDPALGAAVEAATAAGYTTGPTDCDFGAPAALGWPDSGTYTVSVYLSSEADAQAALAAFEATGVDGGVVAEVETYCLD